MNEPLIWTTKGNLPVSSLTHWTEWVISPEQIIFIERYKLGDEIIKESTHIRVLTGVSLTGKAAS